MSISRRIFISMPADRWLSPAQNELKWAVVERIEKGGYVAEVFLDPRARTGLASAKAWTPAEADFVLRRCTGIAVIGMPRWTIQGPQGLVHLPTDYSHYEGAVAYTLRLPMLVLAQEQLSRRVIFENGFGGYIGEFSENDGRGWLATKEFKVPFTNWKRELDLRRDVFLGYCSSSKSVAARIKKYLVSLGVTVLDWRTDFAPARGILEQITEAAARCSTGIFLFTQDDQLSGTAKKKDKAAPRDNVVFEAGYFIQAKGKDRVLIVREDGAKMPADLGGDIYASFSERTRLGPVQESLRRFFEAI